MANLNDLLAQKAELERQIESVQREARNDAVAKVRALMDEYGLTSADLSARVVPRKAVKGGKVAAKYRNSATGDSWSGRGLQPKWLKAALASGHKIDEFAL